MAACSKCGKENPAEAQFCMTCGTPLVPKTPAQEVRKIVTVLFCDVTGSTALGERLDPESLSKVMARYFGEMRLVIERHGGTVEKFIGDAVMAVFGAPVVHEDDALRAVRAAAEMREVLSPLNQELERDRGVTIETRTGVNTGEVLVGDLSPERGLVTGDAVNVAARLEQAAEPGEILIGAETRSLVRDAVVVEPVEPLALKGKQDLVSAFRLIEVVPQVPAHARRLDAPMVGRERQVNLLRQAFEGAVADQVCNLFTILGSAGVGKSRLVEEFLALIGRRATVLRGRCLPYGEGITFWPIIEAVRDAAGIDDQDSPEEARARIAALLEGEEHSDRILQGVAQVIGLPGAAEAPDEMFWSLRKLLETVAHRDPLIICFDDIHWAEPTFLDLIEHFSDWTREAPILLLCLARQELLDRQPSWGGGKLNATTINLEPLSDEQAGELVEHLLGRAELAPDVKGRITEAADGNPLFVEEMISMLIDGGLLRRDDGRWVPVANLSAVPVPPTIQALLAARLDQLGPEERAVVERASVEGKVFHRGALIELCEERIGGRVDPHLAALMRRELIRPDRSSFAGDEAFRFRHLLIRDAAYQAMPKELRAELHERFAAWLERAAGDRITEYREILGYHLEQAYRYRAELGPTGERERVLAVKAAEHLSAAARRATARIDMRAAANLHDRAVSLLPEDEPRYPELLWELGCALTRCENTNRSEAILVEAIERASASGDQRLEARARIDRWWARAVNNPERFVEEMPGEVEPLIPALEGLDDDLGLTKAWQLRAVAHWMSCRFAAMEGPLERALTHARRAGDRLEEMESLESLLEVCRWGPTPVEEGLRRCEQIFHEVRRDRRFEASALGTQGVLRAMLGHFEEARGLLARNREILQDLGLGRTTYGGISIGIWQVEILADEPGAAERDLRIAYEQQEHYAFERPILAAMLAHSIGAQRRYEEAEALAGISKEIAGDMVMAQILSRGAKAKALARLGQLDQAHGLAREAVSIADRTDALNLHGDALMDLAEVLSLADQPREAVPTVQEALRLYEQKGNSVSAGKARALLHELGAGDL